MITLLIDSFKLLFFKSSFIKVNISSILASIISISSEDFIVLVAFGSHFPSVMEQIKKTCCEYETYLPDLPLYGKELFDREFVLKNRQNLLQAGKLFADEESQILYREILQYKWTGKPEYLMRTQQREETFRELFELSDDESYVELLGDKGGVKIGSGETIIRTETDGLISDVKLHYDAANDAFAAEMEKFVAAVRGEGEIPATGEEGLTAMKLLDAIYRSSEMDCEVEI